MKNPFKYYYKWWCPQCGKIKYTVTKKAPFCKGSRNPQDYDFHLYEYMMEEVV